MTHAWRRRRRRAAAQSALQRAVRAVPRRAVALLALTLLIAGLAAGGWYVFLRDDPPGPPRAVIIDQLAATNPNPVFIQTTTKMLEADGYRVDYVPSSAVTVDFYRSLPTHGYTFIVVRSHSYGFRNTVDPVTGAPGMLKQVGLFTTEPYNVATHVNEQLQHDVDAGTYNGASVRDFGIAPSFVTDVMHGHFDHATLLLMGCDGLSSDTLARAFMARGVSEFIGWDNQVTASFTDDAMGRVLHALLVDHTPAPQAVHTIAAQVGADPVYGGRLRSLP
jgi:hypothetical protein